MVNLIIGHKGTGKTKHLVALVNEAMENSNGNVVCVEKEAKLTYDVNYRVRLIDTDQFSINGYDAFYGFLSGICAGDHDITDVLVDTTLKIGGRDYDALASFLKNINSLSEITNKTFTFTVSADKAELPESIFDFCKIL
ncbi:MAG: hypothetical protein K6F09_09800 [Clostridiales bacterium]|nr:hypothetical protein [Clostridiales bacterium]